MVEGELKIISRYIYIDSQSKITSSLYRYRHPIKNFLLTIYYIDSQSKIISSLYIYIDNQSDQNNIEKPK